MKYLVIELQKNENGVVSNIVTNHDSLAEAESKFYNILSAAAVGNVAVHSAVIIRDDGLPVKNKCYKR